MMLGTLHGHDTCNTDRCMTLGSMYKLTCKKAIILLLQSVGMTDLDSSTETGRHCHWAKQEKMETVGMDT